MPNMLHIRRIYDDVLPVNKGTLDQVKEILRNRFSKIRKDDIDLIGEKLRNPFKQRFRMVLFVAESIKGRVRGFATILHEPDIRFVYLDWIATASSRSGGVGGALYERVRREAKTLGAKGLFFECFPDDAENCPDKAALKENRARLRFYEQYGARPIVGTAYESPVSPDDTCMPYLVYDGLDHQTPLRSRFAGKVVQAILERKYADYCPADYVEKVVAGFQADPVKLRPFRYVRPEAVKTEVEGRPAERRSFGGFCYFNNSAIAAQYLCSYGKVAILDIDYHHGNGEQDIFYKRSDVLTISIHGHPSFAYPYFSGFDEERGEGDGEGFNLNLPLPEAVDGEKYRKVLARAIRRIEAFVPQFLVVALGLDPAKADPTGTWFLTARDFMKNGKMVGAMGLPTVVIQEGGYRTRTLGHNAMSFFRGLTDGNTQWADSHHAAKDRVHGVVLRNELQPQDVERVRRLVEITGFFSPDEVNIAAELVTERLAKGAESGYDFIMAEHYGRLAGYACFGPIPATATSYDLYWIAVSPDFQRKGLGRRLLKEAEKRISSAGGKRIYVDTSQRVQYASTRAFYENAGYRLETILEDFYDQGEGKVIYCKALR